MVGYGATYYSYLYAKCLAAQAWQQYMAPDPFCRSAGAHPDCPLSPLLARQRNVPGSLNGVHLAGMVLI